MLCRSKDRRKRKGHKEDEGFRPISGGNGDGSIHGKKICAGGYKAGTSSQGALEFTPTERIDGETGFLENK